MGDYHKAFNAQNFSNWFRAQLIPNLVQPSLIIMDNAAYHKSLPEKYARISKMKKIEVLKMMDDEGINYENNITAIEAKLLL